MNWIDFVLIALIAAVITVFCLLINREKKKQKAIEQDLVHRNMEGIFAENKE